MRNCLNETTSYKSHDHQPYCGIVPRATSSYRPLLLETFQRVTSWVVSAKTLLFSPFKGWSRKYFYHHRWVQARMQTTFVYLKLLRCQQCHLWGFSDKKFFEILIIISNSSRIISFLKVCHWTSSQMAPPWMCSLFCYTWESQTLDFEAWKSVLCVFRERVWDSGS